MLTVPLTFSLAPLPTGLALDANAYAQQIIANLQASFSGNFLTGQTLGTVPSTDIGPWFDGTNWWHWSVTQNQYVPFSYSATYNCLINADFKIWQRQILFNLAANGAYTADRWVVGSTLLTGTADIGRVASSFVTGYPTSSYNIRIQSHTPQTVIGGSEIYAFSQKVERQNALPLFNTVTSLQVVLMSNVVGSFGIAIRNAGQTFSYVQDCAITAPNVPQVFKFENIPVMPSNSGNWGTLDTDQGYTISICLSAGASLQTAPGIWSTGDFFGTTNQTNLFTVVNNYLQVMAVQHEPGPVCNPLLVVPFDQDLRRCQRYYNKSYIYSVFPGSIGGNFLQFANLSTANVFVPINNRFPVNMRTTPTVVSYSNVTGAAGTIRDISAAVDRGVVTTNVSETFLTALSTASSFAAGGTCVLNYTASAEL